MSGSRLARLPILALLALAGCDRTLIVVSVSGLTDDIRGLMARVSLNGSAAQAESFRRDVDDLERFGLELPTGAQGALALELEGFLEVADGCAVALGRGETMAGGERRLALDVALLRLPARMCRLEVQPGGDGAGEVTSEPPGIQCGAACAARFAEGTQVTLRAAAEGSSFFTGWSGPCSGQATCQLTVGAPVRLSAGFARGALLSVQRSGAGSGRVLSEPPGIDCGSQCSALFPRGTRVVLRVQADPGSLFSSWSGACSQPGACTIQLQGAAAVTAAFAPAPCPVANFCVEYQHPLRMLGFPRRVSIRSFWGAGPGDVWAVGGDGYGGVILRYDGGGWTGAGQPFSEDFPATAGDTLPYLNGVWGSGPADVWAVGRNQGTDFQLNLLRYDGSTWTAVPSGGVTALRGIWGSTRDDVWIVGEAPKIGLERGPNRFHYDGRVWSGEQVPSFSAVWGSGPADVWAAGPQVQRFDGSAWTTVYSANQTFWAGIRGSGPRDVWVVGTEYSGAMGQISTGVIAHYDGSSWSTVHRVRDTSFYGVWAAAAGDAWAVGEERTPSAEYPYYVARGVILRYDGASWRTMHRDDRIVVGSVWGLDPSAVWFGGIRVPEDQPIILRHRPGGP